MTEWGLHLQPAFCSSPKNQDKKTEPMKTIKNLTFAALAVTLWLQASPVLAGDNDPQRITFEKCWVVADEPFGGHFEGTVDGDCGVGTVTAKYLSVLPGKGIWHFSGEYSVNTPGCSFTTVCTGTVDVRTGQVVLNGLITVGPNLGARVQVRAQANANLTCYSGTMTITPSGSE